MNFSSNNTIFKEPRKTASRKNKVREGEKAYHNRICHPRVRSGPTKAEVKLQKRIDAHVRSGGSTERANGMTPPGSRQL